MKTERLIRQRLKIVVFSVVTTLAVLALRGGGRSASGRRLRWRMTTSRRQQQRQDERSGFHENLRIAAPRP
jgi:hypothetical protein